MSKEFRARLRLIAIALLLLTLMTSYAIGKYTQTVPIQGRVTFTANLVPDGNFLLQEHEAVRQTDGSYVLTNNVVTENSYILLPGVDVPKDPHIVIKDKTPIKAYLYLEITDGIPAYSGISYTLESCWVPLSEGSNVYVYSDDEGPVVIDHTTQNLEKINILVADKKGNSIIVSQKLQKTIKDLNLQFSAVLKEIVTVTEDSDTRYQTALEVYGS